MANRLTTTTMRLGRRGDDGNGTRRRRRDNVATPCSPGVAFTACVTNPHIPSLSVQFRPGPALTCPHTCCQMSSCPRCRHRCSSHTAPLTSPVTRGRHDHDAAARVRGARCAIRRGATVTSPPALPHGPHRSPSLGLSWVSTRRPRDDPTARRRDDDATTRRRRRRVGLSQSLQPPAPSQSQVQVP